MVFRGAGSHHISYAQLFELLVFENKKKQTAVFTQGALIPHLICHFLLWLSVFMHVSSTYMTVILHSSVPANWSPPKQSQALPWTHCRFQVLLPQRELCGMWFLLFLLLFEPLASTRLLFSSSINKYLLSSYSGQSTGLEYKINSRTKAYAAKVEKIFFVGRRNIFISNSCRQYMLAELMRMTLWDYITKKKSSSKNEW